MFDETYNNYIRNILGYPTTNISDSYESNYNENTRRINSELEECYPEIYKIVYPMIVKKCNNFRSNVTNEDIENMTNEIYYALEEKNEVQININLTNNVRNNNLNNSRTLDKKPDVKISDNKVENRQINSGLRDLIKILLIRELLNRPGIRPPMPGPRPPRPPMPGPGPRPPIRPRYIGNDLFHSDIYETRNPNLDIYENF